MRNLLTVAGLTVATVAATASTAFAGEQSVFNRYTTEKVYNGHTESTINVDIENTTHRVTEANSIKVETYGGDTNISVANYDGDKLTGRGVSTNNVPVDPVSIITTSSTTETFNSVENISVDTITSNDFKSTTFEHEAGTSAQ